MDRERIEKVKRALSESGVDALILRLPENIVMACGHWPAAGVAYAIFGAEEGPLALIAPSGEGENLNSFWGKKIVQFPWPCLAGVDLGDAIAKHIRDLVGLYGLSQGRIGLELSFDTVAPSHNAGELFVPTIQTTEYLKALLPDVDWLDATPLLNDLRRCKSKMEIEALIRAHEIAGYGLDRFMEVVNPGVSEAELAGEVYSACLSRGVELPGCCLINPFPQISSGDNAHLAWRPIVRTGKRRLCESDIAILELAVCVDGYWADVTRVKVAGAAREEQQAAFAAVLGAQEAVIAEIRQGVRAAELHELAIERLRAAGFDRQIVHLTGHGVGFRYHEPAPMLAPGSGDVLEVGNVFSVEPGLYDPSWGGIRLEDNVVVTENGARNLTRARKTL